MNRNSATPVSKPEKALYTIPEVVEILSLSRSQIYLQMEAGRLRYVKVGRSRRITAGAIDEFVSLLELEHETEAF